MNTLKRFVLICIIQIQLYIKINSNYSEFKFTLQFHSRRFDYCSSVYTGVNFTILLNHTFDKFLFSYQNFNIYVNDRINFENINLTTLKVSSFVEAYNRTETIFDWMETTQNKTKFRLIGSNGCINGNTTDSFFISFGFQYLPENCLVSNLSIVVQINSTLIVMRNTTIALPSVIGKFNWAPNTTYLLNSAQNTTEVSSTNITEGKKIFINI